MWINGFGFLIGLSVMIIAFMPSTQEVMCGRVCACGHACTHMCVCTSLARSVYLSTDKPPSLPLPRSQKKAA